MSPPWVTVLDVKICLVAAYAAQHNGSSVSRKSLVAQRAHLTTIVSQSCVGGKGALTYKLLVSNSFGTVMSSPDSQSQLKEN